MYAVFHTEMKLEEIKTNIGNDDDYHRNTTADKWQDNSASPSLSAAPGSFGGSDYDVDASAL